jgi:hypothetical protein
MRSSLALPWFRREGEAMPYKPNKSLLFLDLLLHLSFFSVVGKEVRR